ncbi:hypothetical protein SAG0136_10300 [Streptococcus agalactiae LMG 14747]|uniref:Uncharacterized protein n=1 Tax=Streptococcus agalactiae LMG 14747 TaxID=1154860 RepID=V6Z7G2_STRAG|nr:hypothetical protein SAG0136_10300 [Streptococcus agalactiae LMG 14747]
MNKEKLFGLLESPYTPYIFAELIYVIAVIIFKIKLSYVNKLLSQYFDVERMVSQKDIMIATDVMAFDNNTSWNYLLWGILLIVIGFTIPIISFLINNSSYKREEVKGRIMIIIGAMITINLMLIIPLAKALLSPIVVATLILCAAGSIFTLLSSQS